MTRRTSTCAGLVIALLVASTAGARSDPAGKQNAAAKPVKNSLIGESGKCKKLPSDKRVVRFDLETGRKVGDLIAWISSITCQQFLVPGTISVDRPVTVVAPAQITPSEAYRLFLGALDSTGLTVEPSGKFWRIVETARVDTMGGVPLEPVDPSPAAGSYVTRLVRLECLKPGELERLRERFGNKGCHPNVVPFDAQKFLIITDLAENMRDLPNSCER
jgi:general secretion pathway protein D